MIEKSLHSANIAAAFGVVATAADLTFSAGAATTIGAALSGKALLKGRSRAEQALTKQMALAFDEALDNTGLPKDLRPTILQMIGAFPITAELIVFGGFEAGPISAKCRMKIEDQARDTPKSVEPEHAQPLTLQHFQGVMCKALETILKELQAKDPIGFETMKQEARERKRQEERHAQIMTALELSGEAERLRAAGVREGAIFELAQRGTEDIQDLSQALKQIGYLVDIAVRVQQGGHVASNHGGFVDTVLQRVAELSREGEYKAAGEAIDAALEEQDAKIARLLKSGIEVALLDGDTAKAAQLLVRQADMEVGGGASFEELLELQDHHYALGRDKGLNLQSKLAIDLAEMLLARVNNAEERAAAFNNLGNALTELGERDTDTERLKGAIHAYQNALKESTQERAPLNWAMTQNNLGNVLNILGRREANTKLLEDAIDAFQNALEEWTQERVPLDWAMTQNNIGNALQTLGEEGADTKHLKNAIVAYKEALKEWTRERAPLGWAMTQNNLGNALRIVGEREADAKCLEDAIDAFQNALKEWTRERAPLKWAATQNNFGNVLQILGQRKTNIEYLGNAVQAYQNALLERTRDRVPLEWAMTQNNLANIYCAFFDQTSDASHLDQAAAHLSSAREVFVAAGASQYLAKADDIQAGIDSRRAGLAGD